MRMGRAYFMSMPPSRACTPSRTLLMREGSRCTVVCTVMLQNPSAPVFDVDEDEAGEDLEAPEEACGAAAACEAEDADARLMMNVLERD